MARAGVAYSRAQLAEHQLRWLARLPMLLTIESVTLVHSSIIRPELWLYVLTDAEAEFAMSEQRTPVCFYGHTHCPKLFTARRSPPAHQVGEHTWSLDREGTYLINPGSVGQPRGGGDPRAQFAVFNPAEFTVEFVRLEYDVASAANAIRKVGLPAQLAVRLEYGR